MAAHRRATFVLFFALLVCFQLEIADAARRKRKAKSTASKEIGASPAASEPKWDEGAPSPTKVRDEAELPRKADDAELPQKADAAEADGPGPPRKPPVVEEEVEASRHSRVKASIVMATIASIRAKLAEVDLKDLPDAEDLQRVGKQLRHPAAALSSTFALALASCMACFFCSPCRGKDADSELSPMMTRRLSRLRSTTAGCKVFSLVSEGQFPAPLVAGPGQAMAAFEQQATSVYEVSLGIFMGEATPEQLARWPKHAFRDALLELRDRARAVEWLDAGVLHEPLDDIPLASRLIATQLDVNASLELLHEYGRYRASTQGGVCPSRAWLEYGIVVVHTEDRLGRPVINVRPRYHFPNNHDLFRNGLRCTLDAVKAHLLARRGTAFSSNNPLEQYTMVFDFAGAGWKNLDWEAFHITLEEGGKHYPNMMGQIFLLNASRFSRTVWRGAKRLMDARVRRKVFLIAPSQVASCMRRLLPEDKIPREWGGSGLPWPGPQDAATLEDQVGALVAEVYLKAGVVPAGAKPTRAERSREVQDGRYIRVSEKKLARDEVSSCWACLGPLTCTIR
mmetsp:Transcript_11454/g.25968  ORF Transcript_11454/g.25968 Transcript_11454/m.25968 type:complete len:567 (-) Transcript_11454:34-1734(-)